MKRIKIKKRAKGKGKGGQYERDVCKRLSLWVSKMRRQDCFWRSAMSGGRARIRFGSAQDMRAQCGDITATHQLGNLLCKVFVLECKFYADLDVDLLVWGHQGKISRFWNETLIDAKDFSRLPLMICRQNRQTDIVCVNSKGLALLSVCGTLPINTYFPRIDMHVFFFRDLLMLDYEKFHRNNYDRHMGRVRINKS